MREIEINPLTRETIVILHHASDALLTLLYRSCALVVFPSLYEGFGLPLAEALGYGKPCVSSNATALAEIGGDLVMRIDPKDTLAWSSTIGRLLSSPAELAAWGTRIQKSYHPVTWNDSAELFFGAIKEPAAAT